MLVRNASFRRAFAEALAPYVLVFAPALALSGGRITLDAAGLLLVLLPGAWAALRLRRPGGGGLRRLGHYVLFCLALSAAATLVLVLTLAAVVALGRFSDPARSAQSPLAVLLVLAAVTTATFVLVRGAMALPRLARELGWRRLLLRSTGIGLLALIVAGAAGAATYFLAGEPYVGHTPPPGLQVASSAPVGGFVEGAWTAADPTAGDSLTAVPEVGGLHVTYTPSRARYYTLTREMPAGSLANREALRLYARAGSQVYLALRLHQANGDEYQAEEDLFAGDTVQPVDFSLFMPVLDAAESGTGPDWSQVVRLTLYVYTRPSSTEPVDAWFDGLDALALAGGGPPAWLALRSPHFAVFHHPGDEGAAADVQRAVEDRYARMTEVLNYTPAGRTSIVLVATHGELESWAGTQMPPQAVGHNLYNGVVLLTPQRYSQIYNRKTYADIAQVAPHEVTHLWVNQRLGHHNLEAAPLWLHEGLATYVSGQAGDPAVRAALRDGTLPHVQDLDAALGTNPTLFYAAVQSFIAFLDARDPASIDRLLSADWHDREQALRGALGAGEASLDNQWRRSLEERVGR